MTNVVVKYFQLMGSFEFFWNLNLWIFFIIMIEVGFIDMHHFHSSENFMTFVQA